jgi:hypothetical protein
VTHCRPLPGGLAEPDGTSDEGRGLPRMFGVAPLIPCGAVIGWETTASETNARSVLGASPPALNSSAV